MADGYRNDDRWSDRDRTRDWDRGSERMGSSWDDSQRGGYGERGRERGRDEHRGFFDKAADEVRSWFGSDEDRDRDRSRRGGDWSGYENRDLTRGRYGQDVGDRYEGRGEQYGQRGGSTRARSYDESGTGGGYGGGRDYDREYSARGYGRGGYAGQARGDAFGRGSYAGKSQGFGGQGNSYGESPSFRDTSDEYGRREMGGQSGQPFQGGDYGRGLDRQGGRGESPDGYFVYEEVTVRPTANQDDHYRSWRDRQVQELDRDYEQYCREREQQFHQDFDSWRQNRRSESGESGETGRPAIGSASSSASTSSRGSSRSGSSGSKTTGSKDQAETAGSSSGSSGSESGSSSRSRSS